MGRIWASFRGRFQGQALDAISRQQDEHPKAAIYVPYGSRPGDHFTLGPSDMKVSKLESHDRWDVLLDGPGKFFNSVTLTFDEERLVKIHRHRSLFELP